MPLPLPPRGVFVPTTLIYAPDLSSAAFHTWVQLRGLAAKTNETPPCTIQELSRLTGKSPSALYGHLAMLRSRGALRWRSAGKGILTIGFDLPEEQADLSVRVESHAASQPALRPTYGDLPGELTPTELDSRFQESRFLESGMTPSPSLNPINLKNINEGGESEGGRLQDSGISESGTRAASAGDDPIAIYRDLTGRRPNQTQRHELHQQVTDLDLWRRTLAHWQFHGWNPANLAGILDLYQRGGPPACRYCGAAGPKASTPAARAPRRKPIDDLIDELQQNPPGGKPWPPTPKP